MSRTKKLLFAGLLMSAAATWYSFTGKTQTTSAAQRYPLPETISVVQTTLPITKRYNIEEIDIKRMDTRSNESVKVSLEKVIETSTIDFSRPFEIHTKRYSLINDEDWLPSQIIGQIVSLPRRLFFWDWDIGLGLDRERARDVLAMLESRQELKNMTVRINHNEALYDMTRMFTDDKVADRNPFLARITLGVLQSLGDEIWAEFGRGDYYNPLTQTAVLYSNVESIAAHEIGHHQDFQKFESDWWYAMGRVIPPVMLYQEWRASQNACSIMSADDRWQFDRYLIPAFCTYLLAGYFISRKLLQKAELKRRGVSKDFDELEEYEKPEINPLQTLRHFGTWNASLHAGMLTYVMAMKNDYPDIVAGLGFLAAAWAAEYALNTVLRNVIPYVHEEENFVRTGSFAGRRLRNLF